MYNSDPEKGLRTKSGFISALPNKFKVNISIEIFGKWTKRSIGAYHFSKYFKGPT